MHTLYTCKGNIFKTLLCCGVLFFYNSSFSQGNTGGMTALSATSGNQQIDLAWNTASEFNTQKYEVEYSDDGINYAFAGTVLTKSSAYNNQYKFAHTFIREGRIFYRLKIVDAAGNYSYSNTISVLYTGRSEENFVYPSAIRKGASIIAFPQEPFTILQVINTNGNILKTENLSGRMGRIELPVTFPSSGVYFVRLQNKEKSIVQRIVITE